MTFTLACAETRASQRRTFSHFSINTMSSRSAFDHSRCVVSYSGKSAPSGDRRDDTQQPMALSVEVTPPAQLRVEWLELGPHMHRHIICLPACRKVENSEHANVQPPKRSAVECALGRCVDTLFISKRFNNDVFQTYNAPRRESRLLDRWRGGSSLAVAASPDQGLLVPHGAVLARWGVVADEEVVGTLLDDAAPFHDHDVV